MDEFWAWFIGAWVCVGVSLIAIALWQNRKVQHTPVAVTDATFAAWFSERVQATGLFYTTEQAYRMYQAWCNRSSVEIAQGDHN